jgi:type IV pilus assembly protein PilB
VATRRLGEVLLDAGLLTREQLQSALDRQLASRKRLGEQLLEMGLISEDDLVLAMATHLEIPHVDLDENPPDPEAVGRLSPDLIRGHKAIPLRIDGNRMAVAMLDPLSVHSVELIGQRTGLEVIPFITASDGFWAACERLLPPEPEPEVAETPAQGEESNPTEP